MTILVDTSVWSLALRRDAEASEPEVLALKEALLGSEVVVTTGLVLQELSKASRDPRHRRRSFNGSRPFHSYSRIARTTWQQQASETPAAGPAFS